ncbi:DUF615 domain-containing protein [Alcanivorax sp. ZXX171]|nr:DUF615 domain-containing protein [Alcanivorax sp. ZXX171]
MTEYNDPLPSKTRRKLEMQDLQDVGLKIMDLKAGQQARLPLSDALRAALEEARRINHPDARRRHALYVGRLISDGDTDSLLTALDTLTDPVRQQRLQQWTEQVLACPGPRDAEPLLQRILEFYPEADRQTLRNQARNLIKARPEGDLAEANADQRARLKRERKRFQSLLNELEKNAALY